MNRIDTSYRPETYFGPISLAKHVRTRVKGQVRRDLAKSLAGEGLIDFLPDLLVGEELGEEDLADWGKVHPWCLGGEFLPRFERIETEIARVVLQSVTFDVTSVYARRLKNRIAYRIVDEYGGETLTAKTRRTSTRPLCLKELVDFLLRGWPFLAVLSMNYGCDTERMLRFFRGESAYYPDFHEALVERVVERFPFSEEEEEEEAAERPFQLNASFGSSLSDLFFLEPRPPGPADIP